MSAIIALAAILIVLVGGTFVCISTLLLRMDMEQMPPGHLPPSAIRRSIVITLSGALLLGVMSLSDPKATTLTFVNAFLAGVFVFGLYLGGRLVYRAKVRDR